MPIPRQKIVEEWKEISLKEFAERALEILERDPHYDEMVLPANNITELQRDYKTAPRLIYPLPEGFEYNFSGWWGARARCAACRDLGQILRKEVNN